MRYILIPESGIQKQAKPEAFSENSSWDKGNETKDNCHLQSQ